MRLDGIRLTNTNGWGQTVWGQRICTVTDDQGRSFPLRMPLTDLGAPPATTTVFSATGILNQENSNTNGYSDSDRDGDCHPNSNGNRDADSDRDRDTNSDGYRNSNSDADQQRNGYSNPYRY